MCKMNYCSGNALCKPNYRSLLSGNKLSYCDCPSTHFGHRCELIHDRCISNPCENNGTCFPTLKPNEFSRLCTNQRPNRMVFLSFVSVSGTNHYHGKRCDMKTQALSIKINETFKYDGAVILYFDIHFCALKLILVH
ncbi:unnamed protein product [Rotaria socialis]|uniref:EGF-like domain-containing protein n=1 Tax=Rotaria socialis TaxID=392032 RepID=A0A820MAM8_9BILA|nr:unnamed protein product [Rotaria socialis]